MTEKFIIRGIKGQLDALRKVIAADGGRVPDNAIIKIKICDRKDAEGHQTCDEYLVPFSFLDGYRPGDVNT